MMNFFVYPACSTINCSKSLATICHWAQWGPGASHWHCWHFLESLINLRAAKFAERSIVCWRLLERSGCFKAIPPRLRDWASPGTDIWLSKCKRDDFLIKLSPRMIYWSKAMIRIPSLVLEWALCDSNNVKTLDSNDCEKVFNHSLVLAEIDEFLPFSFKTAC